MVERGRVECIKIDLHVPGRERLRIAAVLETYGFEVAHDSAHFSTFFAVKNPAEDR